MFIAELNLYIDHLKEMLTEDWQTGQFNGIAAIKNALMKLTNSAKAPTLSFHI